MLKATLVLLGGVFFSYASPAVAENFPISGKYEVLKNYAGTTSRFSYYIDASTRDRLQEVIFRQLGLRLCNDTRIEIGGGAFEVAATCKTSDGDIKGIKVKSTGRYSVESFSFSNTYYLFGKPVTELITARLLKSR